MPNYPARYDAQTLAEAAAITGNPGRFQAARNEADALIEEKRQEISGLERARDGDSSTPVALGSPFAALLGSFPE